MAFSCKLSTGSINMFTILILISFSQTVAAINMKLIPNNQNNDISNLTKCIQEIYDLHHSFYKPTIVIYANEDENDIYHDLFTETAVLAVTDELNELNQTCEIYEGTVIIIIHLKQCNDMDTLGAVIFDIKLRYIIIVDTDVKDNCYEVLKTKINELNNLDVVFIIPDEEIATYNLITAIPEVDELICNTTKVTIEFINICQNASLHKKKLNSVFPSKEPINLKKCNFNVGMATLYPYAMVDNEETLKDLYTDANLYGADVELMKIMADIFNSTIKLYYIFRDKQNPYIFQQLVKYLMNGTLDVCAGGLYRVYGDVVAYSGIYSKQSIFWVYTVERERRSWQSFLVKITGLYTFLLTYAVYVILWNVFSQFDYNIIGIIDTLVYAWGALVGAAGLQDARSLKQKILNIMYLIMCLHLSAYVSTQIYYYLTVEGPPVYYKTTDALQLSDKIPYLIFTSKFFVDDKKHTAYVNKSRDCYNFTHCEELMLNNKASTILIEGLLPRLQAASAINDEASVMRVAEDILVIYHEMIARKDSPLVKTFQKSLQSLFEAGICQKIYDEAIGITVVDRAKIANKNILSNSYSCTLGCKITLAQTAITFYIWILGCGISFSVFILEILIKSPKFETTAEVTYIE